MSRAQLQRLPNLRETCQRVIFFFEKVVHQKRLRFSASRRLEQASFTRMHVDNFLAFFALDVAAPVELAVAALRDLRFKRVVTASAAHEVTTVGAV